MAESAVFLDRDGTVIKDKHYLSDPDGVEFFEGVPTALRTLEEAGFKLIIVTNQSGVGRGYMTEDDVEAVHDRLLSMLAERDVHPAGVYYAPYIEGADDPRYREGREFRKPRPGMLNQAADEHGIELSNSYMIGDKESDVVAGERAGARSILVKTGNGRDTLETMDPSRPVHVAENLSAASEWIIQRNDNS